jgi:sugar phosphate isomerase/epimerase
VRIGLGSYAYPWNIQRGMTADGFLDEAIKHQVDVVQVCDNLCPAEIEWDSFGKRAADHAIQVEVGHIGGKEEAALIARIAGKVGSPIARFVIGQALATQSVSEVADDLREAAKIAADNGVRLALENHDFFKAGQLSEIVAAIGHGCGVTLDTANSISNLEGTECIVKHLGKQTLCLHAKDVAIEREFHMYGFRVFGVPAGTGAVDFAYLRDNLPNIQSVILEQWCPPVGNHPPLDQEKETIAQSLRHLRSIWAGQ